jgi:ABC-type microcin C transport system duplicated ATPase subunit YejF
MSDSAVHVSRKEGVLFQDTCGRKLWRRHVPFVVCNCLRDVDHQLTEAKEEYEGTDDTLNTSNIDKDCCERPPLTFSHANKTY